MCDVINFTHDSLLTEVVCRDFWHTTQYGAIKGKEQVGKLNIITYEQLLQLDTEWIHNEQQGLENGQQKIFLSIQNKLHWEIFGRTVAKIIYSEADAEMINNAIIRCFVKAGYRGIKKIEGFLIKEV